MSHASPGPAAHLALLGIVIVAALVIFGIVRWRNKREAAEAETLDPPHSTEEPDRREDA